MPQKKSTPTLKQPSLISPTQPVTRVYLEAESPKFAYYEITVIHLPGAGYAIQKASGARGAKPNVETWFRPSLPAALEKQQRLVNGKLRKTKGRIYREICD